MSEKIGNNVFKQIFLVEKASSVSIPKTSLNMLHFRSEKQTPQMPDLNKINQGRLTKSQMFTLLNFGIGEHMIFQTLKMCHFPSMT